MADILFLLDASGSVRGDYRKQKEYILAIIKGLSIGVEQHRVGILFYSSRYRKRVALQIGELNSKEKIYSQVAGKLKKTIVPSFFAIGLHFPFLFSSSRPMICGDNNTVKLHR